MRVVAVCLAALITGSCSARAGVVAQDRVEIERDAVTPVESTPVESPADTDMQLPVEQVVLVAGDVPGWSIAYPGGINRMTYQASGCALVDTVRSVDNHDNRGSLGSAASGTFYNFVIDLDTVGDATAVLDAADGAWRECTDLGSLSPEPLDVPDGGWRSAGLRFADGGAPVYVGYWQRGARIVKLRVTGPNGGLTFPVLADAVARKLSTGSALADDQPVTTVTPPPENPPPATLNPDPGAPGVSSEPWMDHSLAALILQSGDVGDAWTRFAVTVANEVISMPGAICGYEPPAALAGISASFRRSDSTAVFQQDVAEGDIVNAQAWVDLYRAIAACDTGTGVMYSALPIAVNAAGSDDVAGVLLENDPNAIGAAAVMSVVARYGGVVVMLTWQSSRDDPAFESMPSVDQMTRLLELAAPS